MSPPPQQSRGRGGLAFRLGPVPVIMPWSGVLGVLLIAYLWSGTFARATDQPGQEYVVALIFAVLFYVSILLHEVGHAAMARACGFPVHQIVLWVFGGFTSYERSRESAGREGLIAAAGPAASLLLGGVCWLLTSADLVGSDPSVLAVVAALAWSNIFLGVFNALPGLPLDGGAVLKSIVWAATSNQHRAAVIAAWSGRVVAVVVVVLVLLPSLLAGRRPELTPVVFALLIGGYLFVQANQALRTATMSARVPALSAADLARRVVAVAADQPLALTLRQQAAASAQAFVVVDAVGRPVALSHDEAVGAVPEQRRPWVPSGSV
ncbi:MAG TPA: M50 family metallopeptidase, partial [Candidatus Nanopelagicales bacterium]|nr:M50 family metallopeptidase [Candidatus Nanopelagicales bacterium]